MTLDGQRGVEVHTTATPYLRRHPLPASAAMLSDPPHLTMRFAGTNAHRSVDAVHTVLPRHASRLPYVSSRASGPSTLLHWGQRKLFLSELQFLTEWAPDLHLKGCVVYAGASPGTHVSMLASLFPNLEFHLFDTAVSLARSSQHEQIHVYPRLFTDDDARRFAGQAILFISDIRSLGPGQVHEVELEKSIATDNATQLRWVSLVQASRCLLKLRLPYARGASDTPDGIIMLQGWAGATSTETRLSCASPVFADAEVLEQHLRCYAQSPADVEARAALRIVKMDHTKYEERLAYFNRVTRRTIFPHALNAAQRDLSGLDNSFDSALEVLIIQQYMARFAGQVDCPVAVLPASPVARARLVAQFSLDVGTVCSQSGRRSLHSGIMGFKRTANIPPAHSQQPGSARCTGHCLLCGTRDATVDGAVGVRVSPPPAKFARVR